MVGALIGDRNHKFAGSLLEPSAFRCGSLMDNKNFRFCGYHYFLNRKQLLAGEAISCQGANHCFKSQNAHATVTSVTI